MRKLLGDDRTSLVMLALMFGLAVANWPFLPDRLPIHWSSADASPDSYAPNDGGNWYWRLCLVEAGPR